MKPKILIVDDEKPLRDTLARWFKAKYECLLAPDAAEAMKIVLPGVSTDRNQIFFFFNLIRKDRPLILICIS